MDPIDFHSLVFFSYYGSLDCIESINCLVTDILQNIFLCVQQKKEIYRGSKKLEGE